MNRYRVTVEVTETRIAGEDVTFEVEAENEDAAKTAARDQASGHVRFRDNDFEHDSTDTSVAAVEFIEGDDPPDGRIPRCEKTIDMFEGA